MVIRQQQDEVESRQVSTEAYTGAETYYLRQAAKQGTRARGGPPRSIVLQRAGMSMLPCRCRKQLEDSLTPDANTGVGLPSRGLD